MDDRNVQVPVSLLRDPAHTPSTKVLWMARRLYPDAGPVELAARTGLVRNTAASLASRAIPSHGGPRVKVPGALLAERTVGAQAKLLYGLLQATPGFRGQAGQFTYASLCAFTCLGRNTLKRGIGELVSTGWLQVTQTTRLSPIGFTVSTPQRTRSETELAAAARRLKRAKFGGEALMQEYLSLLIDSDQFTDNARPGFLVSPLTGERLELDRFYPPNVAFEFNGAQHYRSTGLFTQEEADAQRLRDLIKAGICLYEGIHLVIIHADDLSLQGMRRKIGTGMPVRNPAGQEPLIDLLENASLTYKGTAKM